MGKTILVADDSKTIRKVVELTFRGTEFAVVSASDTQEAMTRVREARPDAVLADLQMGGSDGYELCRAIKSDAGTASIPVLLLDSAENPCDDAKAQAAMADGHLKKPFDSQTLIDRIKALTGMPIESQAPMSFAASLAARQKEAEPAPAPKAPPPPPPPPPPAPVSGEARSWAADLGAPGGNGQPAPQPPAPSPFGPPRAEAKPPAPAAPRPTPPPAPPAREELGDASEAAALAPSLEPPPVPGEAARKAQNVDVWALAEPPSATASGGADAIEDIAVDDMPAAPAPAPFPPKAPPQPFADVASKVAEKAAAPIAAAVGPAVAGLPNEELVKVAREVIERIAWEVVPELAELVIRQELERLLNE